MCDFYTECRNGEYSPNEIATWLRENFEQDFVRFNADYHQVASEEIPSNISAIVADVAARRVYPTYAELVTSYGRLVIPDKGYPTLTLKCGDEYLTGKPLRDYIHSHPLEMLNAPKQARPAYETLSADDFLKNTPVLQDNNPPALLRKRFENEFMRFLKSDVGRAWRTRMAEVDAGEISTGLMRDYLVQRGSFTQKDFEDAAVWSCDKFSVTLFKEDIGGSETQGFELHHGGGTNDQSIPLGNSGMAGMTKPDASEDTHVYGESETRRLVRKLGSAEYRQLLNDSPNFRKAVDKYLGGA
ncbi:MAG: hypothetical protein WA197_19175 [Candidatus Acidiferrales bacterium]